MIMIEYLREGELFIPDKDGVDNHSEKSYLSYGTRVASGYKEHPYLVFLEDLKKIESVRVPLYVQIDDTAKARKTFTGGLKVTRIDGSGLTIYEQQEGVKMTSTFSREEYNKIR